MRVSTKGRYGLKAMTALAATQDRPLSLKTIAQQEGIPENYLEQLMAVLKKAELVRSTRGAYGGYVLTKSPADITVGDVLRVLEGDLSPVACVGDGVDACPSGYCKTCCTKTVWEQIFSSTNAVVDAITLEDLSRRQQ